ncbi:MAG: glycosyltransferase [Clostridiales bacterium]|nr:glycosyltransferase [Clostridiales bacterium]
MEEAALTKTKPEIFDKAEVIIVTEDFYYIQNGVIQSVIRKSKFMEEAWGYSPLILVSEYNIDLNRIKNMLQYADYTEEQTSLNKNARVLSVYDYFQKSYSEGLEVIEYKRGDGSDGLAYLEVEKNVFEVRDKGGLIRREFYTGFKERLRQVIRYENGKKSKTIFYDDAGYISSIETYDPVNPDYHPLQCFYTPGRKLCLKAEYRYEPDKSKLTYITNIVREDKNVLVKISVYDETGRAVKECANNAELAAYCLNQIIKDDGKIYIVIDESGIYTRAVAAVQKKNAARAALVHSSFLQDERDLKSDPQIYYEHLCNERRLFDGIIFLTEGERRDFIRKYEDLNNTFSLPHPYPLPIVRRPFEERERKKAVIVSRFDIIKRLDLAIDIFKLVLDKLPEVTLEIYGFGQEGPHLFDKIKTLKLEERVIIKGYTSNPAAVFAGAALSMLTSASEGFGITLVESICNGCPVFAFDIKYGPSDVIEDGETGFLFPFGDTAAFADKLVEYFQDEDLQRRMSENSYRAAARFSKEVFLDKWLSIIETVYRRAR